MDETFRFGFEDDEEFGARQRRPVGESSVEGIDGRDGAQVVTVTVDADANVVAVKLAADWRRRVDLRQLDQAVVQAADVATAQAMALRLENPVAPATATPTADLTPIKPADALRLLRAVTADVRQFTRETLEAAANPVTVRSRGGHVDATGLRGRVVELTVDHGWTHGARDSEIEAELREVLAAVRARTVPPTATPSSPAIAELTALLADPNALLRRVGLLK